MDILTEFISEYGVKILYAVLTGVAGYVALKLKALVEKYIQDKTVKSIVETTVKAVEQIYHDMSGTEKYSEACKAASERLAAKGITVTELELKFLIESTVSSFNYNFRKEVPADGT